MKVTDYLCAAVSVIVDSAIPPIDELSIVEVVGGVDDSDVVDSVF